MLALLGGQECIQGSTVSNHSSAGFASRNRWVYTTWPHLQLQGPKAPSPLEAGWSLPGEGPYPAYTTYVEYEREGIPIGNAQVFRRANLLVRAADAVRVDGPVDPFAAFPGDSAPCWEATENIATKYGATSEEKRRWRERARPLVGRGTRASGLASPAPPQRSILQGWGLLSWVAGAFFFVFWWGGGLQR